MCHACVCIWSKRVCILVPGVCIVCLERLWFDLNDTYLHTILYHIYLLTIHTISYDIFKTVCWCLIKIFFDAPPLTDSCMKNMLQPSEKTFFLWNGILEVDDSTKCRYFMARLCIIQILYSTITTCTIKTIFVHLFQIQQCYWITRRNGFDFMKNISVFLPAMVDYKSELGYPSPN